MRKRTAGEARAGRPTAHTHTPIPHTKHRSGRAGTNNGPRRYSKFETHNAYQSKSLLIHTKPYTKNDVVGGPQLRAFQPALGKKKQILLAMYVEHSLPCVATHFLEHCISMEMCVVVCSEMHLKLFYTLLSVQTVRVRGYHYSSCMCSTTKQTTGDDGKLVRNDINCRLRNLY